MKTPLIYLKLPLTKMVVIKTGIEEDRNLQLKTSWQKKVIAAKFVVLSDTTAKKNIFRKRPFTNTSIVRGRHIRGNG